MLYAAWPVNSPAARAQIPATPVLCRILQLTIAYGRERKSKRVVFLLKIVVWTGTWIRAIVSFGSIARSRAARSQGQFSHGQTMNIRSTRAVGARFILALLLVSGGAGADELNLEQYRGKVVVVDFWASWCVPCRRSFPWLNRMQQSYGDNGLVVVGINLDQDPAEADAFLAEYPAEFRIVTDPDGVLARQFNVTAMPSSYVIGRNGEVAKRHLGFKVRKQDEYEAAIVATLESK